ncbi:MAG: DUF1697 domain-containing protein [Xanthomonadales bacterium]|nr:DUF1697 domain-containing protein [Xanthomonadales bacterium]
MSPPRTVSSRRLAEPHVALLRGINVGGKNVIRMADLRACFEGLGCAAVETYIQSGNVVFRPPAADAANRVRAIERALSERFDYASRVVLRSRASMLRVVDEAPKGFGTEADTYRYDVLFLRPGTSASGLVDQVPVREGVDTVDAGTDVLYCSRLIARAAQSRLSKLASMPIYQEMTVRNWRTTTRLLEMLEAAQAD